MCSKWPIRLAALFLALCSVMSYAFALDKGFNSEDGLVEDYFIGSIKDNAPLMLDANRQEHSAQLLSTESGTCGDNLTWRLDDSGVLTISGTGPMSSFITSEEEGTIWFQHPWNDSKVRRVNIEYGVTSIGDAAFTRGDTWSDSEKKALISISIPSSVTYIGRNAFADCHGLTNLIVPDSVTSIGDCAFLRCRELTDLTISSSLGSIGNYTFGGCSGLTSLNIPDSVTSIGESAFRGCSGLTSLTIPTA